MKIGVYICHCGSNIAGMVDVPEVTEAVGKLKNVVVARYNKYTCAGRDGAVQQQGQNHVKQ